MTFKKTEKEFIKTIVKYNKSVKSLAEVINNSLLFEKRGIAIIPYRDCKNLIFLKREIYDYEDKEAFGYITELISLVESLIKERYIVLIPIHEVHPLVIGKKNATMNRPELIEIDNGSEYITLNEHSVYWFGINKDPIYWSFDFSDQILPISKTLNSLFTVSQELKNLVKHNFKSEEERRFIKQQWATWISIFIAIVIGIIGLLK